MKSSLPSPYFFNGSLFFPCARCENAEAYEVQDGGKSTGIFTKYLNKHILDNRKVTHMLEQVSEGQCLALTALGHMSCRVT